MDKTLTLPVWQHISLMLIGSLSIANLYHIYTKRTRTRNVKKSRKQKKTFKSVDVIPVEGELLDEDAKSESDESGEDEDEDEDWESEIEEVLQGEIKNYTFPTEPFKQVLCVNTDLKKMDKGKAMAQCAHATLGAYRIAQRYAPSNLRHWLMFGQTKIALKCSENDMLEVAEKCRQLGIVSYTVEDAGRTQIPAGSKTVCAIGPAPQSIIDKITGDFKLM